MKALPEHHVLTEDQRAFAAEVVGFFETDAVRAAVNAFDLAARRSPDQAPEALTAIHRLLGAQRLLAPGWPREFGGRGLGPVETALVHRELVRRGLPDLLFVVSVCYAGQVLLLAGSDVVRKEFLPQIASGAVTACTLYSEPEAGSDLASLRTRAEAAPGGGYRLFGTKTYSQATEHAGHGLVAARTAAAAGAPHDGITLFWAPLRAPGVTVRTDPCLSDHPFSTVEFDGLEVPARYVVGEPGEAWLLLNEALAVERTGLEAHLKMRAWLEVLAERSRQAGTEADSQVSAALADLAVRVDAGGFLAWEQVGRQARGELDPIGAAMSKWWNTELGRPLARLALDLGADAEPPDAAPGTRAADWYREAPGLTLSAGSSEIMLYSIAGGHLRVQTDDATATALDGPAAGFRRRIRALARTLRAQADPWPTLVHSGTLRLTLPAAAGGFGAGLAESVVAAEEFGRVLLRTGYQGTIAVAELAAAAGPDSPLRPLAERAARGEIKMALATDPAGLRGAGRTEGSPILTYRAGGGATVTGRVATVAHAGGADLLIVAAAGPAADGGRGPGRLLAVRRDQPGVVLVDRDDLGLGDVSAVEFTAAEVAADGILTGLDDPPFAALLDRLQLRQAGYLLGLSAEAFEATVERTKGRRQFGQTIASFQHVSFRLAALASRLHTTRSLVRGLAARHDTGVIDPARSAAALALLADLARDATAEAVQLHGAHGYSRSTPIQLYYRQAAVESGLFGSPQQLRAGAAAGWQSADPA